MGENAGAVVEVLEDETIREAPVKVNEDETPTEERATPKKTKMPADPDYQIETDDEEEDEEITSKVFYLFFLFKNSFIFFLNSATSKKTENDT